ncbi:MAG: hypothetical protein K1060chlam5_00454 [Candidatus Anoxychlamydiales bacterium]|nr:hypothetical protein [Candidatus Anoxychlamydiales bacterium]
MSCLPCSSSKKTWFPCVHTAFELHKEGSAYMPNLSEIMHIYFGKVTELESKKKEFAQMQLQLENFHHNWGESSFVTDTRKRHLLARIEELTKRIETLQNSSIQ